MCDVATGYGYGYGYESPLLGDAYGLSGFFDVISAPFKAIGKGAAAVGKVAFKGVKKVVRPAAVVGATLLTGPAGGAAAAGLLYGGGGGSAVTDPSTGTVQYFPSPYSEEFSPYGAAPAMPFMQAGFGGGFNLQPYILPAAVVLGAILLTRPRRGRR